MSFIYDDYPVFSYNYGYDPYNYGNNEVIMNQMDVAPNFNEVLFSNFPYNNDDQYIVLNYLLLDFLTLVDDTNDVPN